MKNKLLMVLPIVLISMTFNVIGFTQLASDNSSYVVIGAFAIEGNAIQFISNAQRLNLKAELAINPARKLYYVYVLHTADSSEANSLARKIRIETPYSDTWVYRGFLNDMTGKQIKDVAGLSTIKKLPQVEVADQKIVEPEGSNLISSSIEIKSAESTKSNSIVKDETVSRIPDGTRGFIFRIAMTTGEELKGEVDIIDADKLTKAGSYEGNKQIYIKPVNKTGNISVICEVFGYRKVQKQMNYNQPESTPQVVLENGNAIVPFELIRLYKGDIAVMYNVFFFNDAAIMRPESRYEVNSLTEMLKENLKYKIKLHGHTNGNRAGKIIRMGDTKNFFSLSGSADGYGSSKELSESRAEVIRDFLISEGIDVNRVLIKAWGGKKALYDKGGSRAHENARVEVEILED